MARKEFHVTLAWDGEANVWYVAETDVPGLSTWGATVDDIMAKIEGMVPELLEMNAHLIETAKSMDFGFDASLPILTMPRNGHSNRP